MKTGIELITNKRERQLTVHGRTIKYDRKKNIYGQLRKAAMSILNEYEVERLNRCPAGWNREQWKELCNKPYKERLALAGAWCAAEIDRI